MSRCHVLGVSVSLAVAVACRLDAQVERVVKGEVRDSSGQVVAFARIQARAIRTNADTAGNFQLRVPDTLAVAVEIRRLGLVPLVLNLTSGRDTTIAVTMVPIAAKLEARIIREREGSWTLQRRGFYRRQEQSEKGIGRGSFFTREDIEARMLSRVTQLIGEVQGVRLVRACDRSTCIVPVSTSKCPMTVYMDGVRLTSGRTGRPTAFIDDLVLPSSISGMEVYPRAINAPLEFPSASGNCGVIVIWSGV
jgi:hypothetical protein